MRLGSDPGVAGLVRLARGASQAQRRAALLLGAQYDEEPTHKRARLPWIGSWSLPLIVYGGAAPGTMFSRSRLNDFD